jgi:hypothetical protein
VSGIAHTLRTDPSHRLIIVQAIPCMDVITNNRALVGNFENTKYIQSIGLAARTKYLTAAGLPATAGANQALASGAITRETTGAIGHRPSIHGSHQPHTTAVTTVVPLIAGAGANISGHNDSHGITMGGGNLSHHSSSAPAPVAVKPPWIVNNRWLLKASFPFKFGLVASVVLICK